MKKVILLIFLLFVIVALAGGYYIWSNKDTIVSDLKDTIETKLDDVFKLPEYGKKEYIRSRYGDILDQINNAADNSNSHFKFGATIEELKLPPEFVYVGFIKDKKETDIIKRFKWNRSSTITNGEYGAGYLEGDKTINIMIYDRKVDWTYMDNFIVYIEYTEDVNNKSSELEG